MSEWMKPSTRNNGGGDWQELGEGQFRFVIGKPELKFFDSSEKPSINFPLKLTEAEIKRHAEVYGEPEAGKQQSYRPAFGGYTVGCSLGWYDRANVFQTTKLVDFLTACFGQKNQKAVRKWIEDGACPPLDEGMSNEEQGATIIGWLEYVEDLELIGTVKHSPGKTGGVLAKFGGPIPIGTPGTIWGQDPDYQALGRGKLRAWQVATGGGSAVEQGVAEGAAYSEKGEPIADQPEMLTAPAAPSAAGLRMDDHDHVTSGICLPCYERLFKAEQQTAGVA